VIIELIGPMAVGKSTIAPIVAERLGIADYRGQGFHGLDNQPLTSGQLWADRILSVLRRPGLFVSAARRDKGDAKMRVGFALNLCRRDRFVSMAARAASGVIAGGPVHAIAQRGAWIETDLTPLGKKVTRADAYVRLIADPTEVQRRLSTREYFPQEYVDRHGEWIERYDEMVTVILAGLDRPVVEVNADDAPEIVAEAVAAGLGPLTDIKGG
jgi:hypothetical protein